MGGARGDQWDVRSWGQRATARVRTATNRAGAWLSSDCTGSKYVVWGAALALVTVPVVAAYYANKPYPERDPDTPASLYVAHRYYYLRLHTPFDPLLIAVVWGSTVLAVYRVVAHARAGAAGRHAAFVGARDEAPVA